VKPGRIPELKGGISYLIGIHHHTKANLFIYAESGISFAQEPPGQVECCHQSQDHKYSVIAHLAYQIPPDEEENKCQQDIS
jgi:hypothetical protein